jgi:HEAT repeat protein
VPVDESHSIPISPRKLHVRVGLAFVQVLRPLLYVLLAAAAALTFVAGEDGGRKLPPWMLNAAPTVFGIFLVVFAVYRLRMMAAKRYPALLGFFQIGLAALVWVLLLPSQRHKIAAGAGDDVQILFASTDPHVRAVAAEVAGYRGDPQKYAHGLLDLLADENAYVRQQARAALARMAGADPAAGADDATAARIWRDEAKRRGWLSRA